MTSATSTRARRIWAARQAGRLVDLVDRRVAGSRWALRNARTAVPNHWSFWLGYLALFSLVAVFLSGVFLALWFEPSMTPVRYDGGYTPLRGVVVSEAYASTLDISFEIRGGLLTRQIHYWATHVFVAAMAVHLLRVLFTGAFRTPRKSNWLIGLGLMVVGIVAAYTGHALPDDLLSGTGLRVVEGGVLAVPIVGTYLSSFIFGGPYPGDDIIGRLHVLHVYVIPALLVALLAAHLVLVRRQGRTQRRGAGRTNRNFVGPPRTVHISKAAGLMLVVFGAIVIMAATLQINPVWLHGPYDPALVSARSRPDWYMAFLDGALRLMPPWTVDAFGHELTLSLLIPVVVLPGLLVAALAVYPWIEQKIVGARGEQHLVDRPRDMPARTGLGAAFIAFYVVLWAAAGNDVLATVFHVPVNWMTRSLQIGVVLMPPLAYTITKRICLGLQRRDRDTLLHGRETGVNVVDAAGGYSELRVPLSREDVYELTSRERQAPFDPGPETDENGIPAPRRRSAKLRARLSRFYLGDLVDQPTAAEIGAAVHHEHANAAPATQASEDGRTDER